jgi:hypothetical protein
MNSCTSTLLSACAPPLRMFSIGTGSRWAFGPADVAEQRQAARVGGALATARLTPSMALAPEPALVGRAVEVDEDLVDDALLGRLDAQQLLADDVEHRVDGLLTPLPP